MDLAKFASLLETHSLFFSRSDKLGDPFEGTMTKPLFDALTNQGREIESQRKSFDTPAFMEQVSLAHKMYRTTTFINCWHMNNHESAAMWRLYSLSDQGIAITTTYDMLSRSLHSDVKLGIVNYIDFDKDAFPAENLMHLFMHERMSFAHEAEVRALICVSGHRNIDPSIPPPGILEPISLEDLIHEIYVHPESQDWFLDLVEALCRRFQLQRPVKRSSLASAPIL